MLLLTTNPQPAFVPWPFVQMQRWAASAEPEAEQGIHPLLSFP